MAHDELVIEHYGVKGMKWGVRKAVDRAKTSGRMGINTYVHPVATTKVALKTAKTRPSSLVYNSTKNAKKFNSDVRKEVDRSKKLKSDKKKNVQSAKDNYKQSVAKADMVWYREFDKVKKKNPNANYGEVVNKTLSTPSVKKTQAEAYKARMAIKKAKNTPLSKKPKRTPATAAMRKIAEIPKEFNPKLMPDGRSIEVTGKNGVKEVWKIG